MVDAEPPRELGQPGLNRRVVAQAVEVLVGAREDLLEDILGGVLGEPETLDGDRVDVAREPFDELAPGVLISGPATGDELGSGQVSGGHANHEIAVRRSREEASPLIRPVSREEGGKMRLRYRRWLAQLVLRFELLP